MPKQLPATQRYYTHIANSDLCTVTTDNAYQRMFQAAANSLTALKWVVDISAFQNSLESIILAMLV